MAAHLNQYGAFKMTALRVCNVEIGTEPDSTADNEVIWFKSQGNGSSFLRRFLLRVLWMKISDAT
jgi:hypothetical protein